MKVLPISGEELARLRSQGHDDSGNPWTPVAGGSGKPVRCCLRRTTADERVVLISYRPVRPRGFATSNQPYDEAGPVFVHAEECASYVDDGDFPPAWREHPQVLRMYDDDGELLDGVLTQPDEDRMAIAAKLLIDSHVEFVHARSVGAGCFSFEIRR